MVDMTTVRNEEQVGREQHGREQRQTGRAAPACTWLKGLKAIAGYLDCSEKTALKYIREHDLPASKEGGGWLTSREAIDGWRVKGLKG